VSYEAAAVDPKEIARQARARAIAAAEFTRDLRRLLGEAMAAEARALADAREAERNARG
jgi:hypothetical protein